MAFLTLISSLLEGIGILFAMPLIQGIETSDGDISSDNKIIILLRSFLILLGINYTVINLLITIAIIFLFKGFVSFATMYYNSFLRSQLLFTLKKKLFDGYTSMTYEYYSKRDTGHFVNIINGQIEGVMYGYQDLVRFVIQIFSASVYLVFAFIVAWRFGIIVVILGGFLLLSFRFINRRVQKISRLKSGEGSYLNHMIIQILYSYKYLSSTSQVKILRDKVLSSISRLVNYQFKTDSASGLMQVAQEPIAICFVCILMITQIAYFDQPLGPILISILMFYRAFGAMMIMQSNLQNTFSYSGNFEMVYNEFTSLSKNREINGHLKVKSFNHSLKLLDVNYSYENNSDNVLNNLNITINVNTTIALIGESGSGKSTLVDIITLVLKPNSGLILVDGINAKDIDLDSWRKQIGYVSQEAVIFDDTIANNICLNTKESERDKVFIEKIIYAAKLADLDDFINTLPSGYSTVVGERGVRLSGGQRQRLFIAREIFRNPRVLILDEATSALDSESELSIQKSIDKLKGKVTVIIIAHRLSTIKNVDYVYLLHKGSIIEHGSYEQLKNLKTSKLNKLIDLQNI